LKKKIGRGKREGVERKEVERKWVERLVGFRNVCRRKGGRGRDRKKGEEMEERGSG
jgi:hypothetical protein